MNFDQLAQQLTTFYYNLFQQRTTRLQVLDLYADDATANYNGRAYSGKQAIAQALNSIQINYLKFDYPLLAACPIQGGACLINIMAQFVEIDQQNQQTSTAGVFTQNLVVAPAQTSTGVHIVSDIFAVIMQEQQQQPLQQQQGMPGQVPAFH